MRVCNDELHLARRNLAKAAGDGRWMGQGVDGFGGWVAAMLKSCRAVSARHLFVAVFVLFWCSAIDS